MRRPLLALVLLGGVVVAAVSSGSTAANDVSSSTLERGQMRVVGGVQRGVSYSYVGQVATGFTVDVRGNLLLKTVTARYDGAGSLVCVKGGVLSSLIGPYTPVTCTGLAPEAGLPDVTVTIS